MALRNKKKYVNPVDAAREKVNLSLATFTQAKADLEAAVDTLEAAAASNRDYAAELVTEAESLTAEAEADAAVARKLADLIG